MHPLIFDRELGELLAKTFGDVLQVERTLIKVLPVDDVALIETTLELIG